jgi:hypothetical protein
MTASSASTRSSSAALARWSPAANERALVLPPRSCRGWVPRGALAARCRCAHSTAKSHAADRKEGSARPASAVLDPNGMRKRRAAASSHAGMANERVGDRSISSIGDRRAVARVSALLARIGRHPDLCRGRESRNGGSRAYALFRTAGKILSSRGVLAGKAPPMRLELG